jgi:hypothetical protein
MERNPDDMMKKEFPFSWKVFIFFEVETPKPLLILVSDSATTPVLLFIATQNVINY